MHKLSVQSGDCWVEHVHPAAFQYETTTSGGERLRIGVPAGEPAILRALADRIAPPLLLLYVLHTPRGEGEAGRYQSPPLNPEEFHRIVDRYGRFLSGDGRHDLWVHSRADDATLVWDRHNHLFAYGPLAVFETVLLGLGFEGRALPPLPDHMHHYRTEFDAAATELLAALDWSFSPLRPEDEQ